MSDSSFYKAMYRQAGTKVVRMGRKGIIAQLRSITQHKIAFVK